MTQKIQVAEREEVIEVPIDYHPFPKQNLFHESAASFRLFGGAAGPGKTKSIVMEATAQCLESPVPIEGLLMRRTYPELEQSLIKKFREEVPAKLYHYNQQKHLVTFKKNKSTIQFGYCRNENDVYRYQSAEYDFIGIDELTHFTEFQFWYLMSRLRTTKLRIIPNMFGGTNPGNIGHLWVRSLFVRKDRIPPLHKQEDFFYQHALIYDNPVLIARDPGYLKRLEALPEAKKQALLFGNWDIFEGQFFEEWLESVHVVSPFTPPVDWKRFRAIDYGSSAPFSCGWYAINPRPDQPPEGREDLRGVKILRYKEYYYPFPDPHTGEFLVEKRTDTQNFEQVRDLSRGEEISYTVADPSIWAGEDVGKSIAATARAVGIICTPADNDRQSGWSNMREYLRWVKTPPGRPETDMQPPLFKVTSNCYHFIRTVPGLIYDDKNIEDIADGQEDHAPDEGRYALKSLKTKVKISDATKTERQEERENKQQNRRRPIQERFRHSNFGQRR